MREHNELISEWAASASDSRRRRDRMRWHIMRLSLIVLLVIALWWRLR